MEASLLLKAYYHFLPNVSIMCLFKQNIFYVFEQTQDDDIPPLLTGREWYLSGMGCIEWNHCLYEHALFAVFVSLILLLLDGSFTPA
ncbi:hypothetical protein SAMN05421736_101151 [Evansella caseinilytica]|uniref:Uncharacterized protein n=1 Tax=Evansella caseinilytica TaxID=1503961 RepID=A0A1H3GH83_9BACI|nr:hypothetical protein SAMN05421736_101151 [Evansella caseinilytica]